MSKKSLFIGYLAENQDKYNGQTIRTRNVKKLLEQELNFSITAYDTIRLRKRPLSIVPVLFGIRKYDSVFVLLAHRGVRFLLPLVCFFGWLFRKNIYFVAIGGWLPEFIIKYFEVKWALTKTEVLFVQTELMASQIRELSPTLNVQVLPNFKFHNFEKPEVRVKKKCDTLKLVYISQISLIKGIDTVEFLMDYCQKNNLNITIDLYGPIKEVDTAYVNELISNNNLIRYLGVLNRTELFETLSTYDLMVFPTHHLTEGFPGVILDAFIAGLPILAAKWNYGPELIRSDFGQLYEHDNKDEALKYLLGFMNNRERLAEMGEKSYLNREKYTPVSIARNLSKLNL